MKKSYKADEIETCLTLLLGEFIDVSGWPTIIVKDRRHGWVDGHVSSNTRELITRCREALRKE